MGSSAWDREWSRKEDDKKRLKHISSWFALTIDIDNR